ncbi:MAG: hypothetical protein GXO25_02265 [Euryarchaeota archaeon]|nr:hypothetical protein [Euryarchaeota archaeon]
MEYGALIAMLEHLVRMGYLTHGTNTQLGACKTCPLNKICSKRNYKVYFLTDRGRKLISR